MTAPQPVGMIFAVPGAIDSAARIRYAVEVQ